MNTNRYELKSNPAKKRKIQQLGPGWCGLAIAATCAFALAIWFLCHYA
jgi:hypothetical protein